MKRPEGYYPAIMRKVLIIGPGGAGKSTLAHKLGRLLNIEVLHLDRFYWQPGWVEMPKPDWLKKVEELSRRDAWIMDGNYSGTLELRVRACDTVIFMDMPRALCLWRVLKRSRMYRKKSRPDVGEGCPEKLPLSFLLWIWNYSRRTRPKVVRLLEANRGEKKIVWLRSQRDVERFLSEQGAANN
ncbi:MAG TPA: DNA topology modulation protein [Pyrinomonadaceae bacterium]|nr:DNA topology modulation protein [Pyrinomonadaceae bacterium]